VEQIKYREGYKYQLHEPYTTRVSIFPPATTHNEYVLLKPDGEMIFAKGYAWDGCSGPTWDDKTNMRAGLIHDGLYNLMRDRKLDCGWRETADDELRRICQEDGMSWVRAWYYHKAVRMAGESSAAWQEAKVCVAPT
jgi:hypothetical protein